MSKKQQQPSQIPPPVQNDDAKSNGRKRPTSSLNRRVSAPALHGHGTGVKKSDAKLSAARVHRLSSVGSNLKKTSDVNMQSARNLNNSNNLQESGVKSSSISDKVRRTQSARGRSATPKKKEEQEPDQQQQQQQQHQQEAELPESKPRANSSKRKSSRFASKITRLSGIGGKVGGILHGRHNSADNHAEGNAKTTTTPLASPILEEPPAKAKLPRGKSLPSLRRKSTKANDTHTFNANDLDILRQNLGEFSNHSDGMNGQKAAVQRRPSRSLERAHAPEEGRKRSRTPSGKVQRERSVSSESRGKPIFETKNSRSTEKAQELKTGKKSFHLPTNTRNEQPGKSRSPEKRERDGKDSRGKEASPQKKQPASQSSPSRNARAAGRKQSGQPEPRGSYRDKLQEESNKHRRYTHERRKSTNTSSRPRKKDAPIERATDTQEEQAPDGRKDPKVTKRERLHVPKTEPQSQDHRSTSTSEQRSERKDHDPGTTSHFSRRPFGTAEATATAKGTKKDEGNRDQTRRSRDGPATNGQSGKNNVKARGVSHGRKDSKVGSHAVKTNAPRRQPSPSRRASSGLDKEESDKSKRQETQREKQESENHRRRRRRKMKRSKSVDFGQVALIPYSKKPDRQVDSDDEWYEELYNTNSPIHSLSPVRNRRSFQLDGDEQFNDDEHSFQTKDYAHEEFSNSCSENVRKDFGKYSRPEPVKSFYESTGGDEESLARSITSGLFGRSNSPELRKDAFVVDEDDITNEGDRRPPEPIQSFHESVIAGAGAEGTPKKEKMKRCAKTNFSKKETDNPGDSVDVSDRDTVPSKSEEAKRSSDMNDDDDDEFDETIDIMSESSLPESLVGESYKKEDKNLDGDYCDEGKIGSLADNLSESPPDCDENDDDKKDCIESHSGSEVEDECNKQNADCSSEKAPSTDSGATKHPSSINDAPQKESCSVDSGATKHPPSTSNSLSKEAPSSDSGATKHPSPEDGANPPSIIFPPMHSKIRSMKPKPSKILLSNKKPNDHNHAPSWMRSVMVEKGLNDNTIEIDADASTSFFSEVTTPSVLLRAPPLHSTIRSRKPKSSSDSTLLEKGIFKLGAGDNDFISEIDVHTIATKDMSEVTVPKAILHPRSHGPPTRFRTRTEKEDKKFAATTATFINRLKQMRDENLGSSTPFAPPRPTQINTRIPQNPPHPPNPPPPRRPPPPPPARRVSKPGNSATNTSDVPPDSFEELAASYYSDLPTSANNFECSTINESQEEVPMKPPSDKGTKATLDSDLKGSTKKTSEFSDSMQDLSDAAAQLLSGVQSAAKAPSSNERRESTRSLLSSNTKSSDLGNSVQTTKQHNLLNPNRRNVGRVQHMPFTDQNGDFGIYTGEVNEDSQPHGKGSIKYDNGIFFTGTWSNGVQEGNVLRQRERLLSGFTSWKGAQAGKRNSSGQKVFGMTWIDKSGSSGKYTGSVNEEMIPDGFGVMRYDFGLIAEGDWVKGNLVGGPSTGVVNAGTVFGGTIAPGMSVVYPTSMPNVGGASVYSGFMHPQYNNFSGGQS